MWKEWLKLAASLAIIGLVGSMVLEKPGDWLLWVIIALTTVSLVQEIRTLVRGRQAVR